MADFELDRDAVARVREAADLVEVASEHVRLKRRGRTFEGLCPFHEEKTPSFSVDPEKGLYYCFGCHQGGDVFKLVMQLEKLSFPEAVERLASRFGVVLPPKSPEARWQRQREDRLRSLLEEAQRWFEDQLEGSDGGPARAELERRGFARPTWRELGFGWAPDDWRPLLEALARRHPEGVVVEAGLAVQPEGGRRPYDRFRGRITFPIRSGDGRLIAFGGRVLGPGEPKYLNSPEGPLFHKRSTLFCLDRARRALAERGVAVVVEGYFDCLSLHRVGITEAVATLGTALTPDHARLLRRRLGEDGRVLLCYDADAAGQRAAAAGARVLLEAGLDVAVVTFPAGQDPDDVVRHGGAEAFRAAAERPMALVDFLLGELPEARAERRRLAAEVGQVLAAARNPHGRDELFFQLGQRLGLSDAALRELARSAPRTADVRVAPGRPALASGETMLVRIVLDGGRCWQQLIADQVEPGAGSDARLARLIGALRSYLEDDSEVSFARWLQDRVDDDELLTLVAEVATRPGPELTDEAVRRQLGLLLREQWRAAAGRLGAEVRAAEDAGDTARVDELQRQLSELRTRRPGF